MKKKDIVICLSLATLFMSLNAQERYKLDELIMFSLENAPDLNIAKSQYDASRSRSKVADANYLPQIDLHASAGKIGMSDLSNPNSNRLIDDNLILGKLSLKQIIYDFGKTAGNSEYFEYQSQAYKMDKVQKVSDKIEAVKSAYYAVLKSIALIDVHKENVKLSEVQLYRSKKYFQAGIRTIIDISDAEVSLIKASLELKKAEYNLKSAYAKLDKSVGFTAITQEYSVYSKELELSSLYNSLVPYALNLEESILFAYANRAELKKQQADIQAAQAEVRLASSEYYPALYVVADYTKQKLDKLAATTPQDQWQATLNLDWNLYGGGKSDAKSQEKKIQTDISNSQYAYTKLSIKEEITDAYINVNRSKDSVALAQSLVAVSSQKFDQASKRYKHGLSDYIELQQSRQDYIDSKATLVDDYYAYYIAIAVLDNRVGR